MKPIFSFILAVVLAMILPGAEAGTLGRLRRHNPVIQVGWNAVRQIVGPFDRFKLLQSDSEEEAEIYIEDEEFDFLSMSYEMSMSMSMAEPTFPPKDFKDDVDENEPLFRGGRVRGGLIRRKFRGSR